MAIGPGADDFVKFFQGSGDVFFGDVEFFQDSHGSKFAIGPAFHHAEEPGGVFDHDVGALLVVGGRVVSAGEGVEGHPKGRVDAGDGAGIGEAALDMFGQGFTHGHPLIFGDIFLGARMEKFDDVHELEGVDQTGIGQVGRESFLDQVSFVLGEVGACNAGLTRLPGVLFKPDIGKLDEVAGFLRTEHFEEFAFGEGLADFFDDDLDPLGFDVVQVSGHAEVLFLLQVGGVDGAFGSGGSGIEEGSVAMAAGSHGAEGQIQHDLIHGAWTESFDQIDVFRHHDAGCGEAIARFCRRSWEKFRFTADLPRSAAINSS